MWCRRHKVSRYIFFKTMIWAFGLAFTFDMSNAQKITPEENCGQSVARPEHYDFQKNTGHLRRCNIEDLPWKVHSNHRELEAPASFDEVFLTALNVWNAAAESIKLGRKFFEPASDPAFADIEVYWSGVECTGEKFSPDILARACLTACLAADGNPSHTYINGIVMQPPATSDLGKTTETLCQELGHILGLGHSDDSNDLMYEYSHNHVHKDLSEVKCTDRDRQMLRWLYAQWPYVPTLSRKR